MGTNYYHFDEPACTQCNRKFKPTHIGKSSYGWVFALHVDEWEGVNCLDDWKARFQTGHIYDEYERPLTPEQMIKIIEDKQDGQRHPFSDSRCVGRDEFCDYITGDFS